MFITDDGIRLSIEIERPENAPGKCPMVILLHGFSSAKDRTHTLAAAQAMRSEGFATLRMDLYGHGESGGTFRDHTLFKWISNTMAAIDYARGLPDVTDIWLSGHSQGGLVAALAAGMEPDRIRGLILRAPAFMIPQGAREGNLLGYSFDPRRIPETVPTIKGLELSGNYIRVAQTIHAEDAEDRYDGPVLILQGDLDDCVPPACAEEAARRYRHGELAMIHGETHHFDRYPETMVRLIREWLARMKREETTAFPG